MDIQTSSIYEDNFENWEDVVSQFQVGDEDEKKEPDAVYHAGYTYENYEGSAYVAYRRGDKYFTVSGGHCSCYGLEEQWEPEEYDLKTFKEVLDRQDGSIKQKILKALEEEQKK